MCRYMEAVVELTENSNNIAYFIDDKCPTCNYPDKDELDRVRELCRYASEHGVRLKSIVVLPGNSAFKYLTTMLGSVSANHHTVFPAIFYRGSWYKHSEDMLHAIHHVVHQAEEGLKAKAERGRTNVQRNQ